jgi:hypothetical protein
MLGGGVAVIAISIVTAPIWLPKIGRSLVLDVGDATLSSATADVVGVPDSAWISSAIGVDRVLFASGWIGSGRAEVVVMTCGSVYGISGCEMAQRDLAAQGKPRLPLREVPLPSSPTPVEAAALLAEVSRLGAKSAIILVDPLVSRRSNRVYQREGAKRGIHVTVLYVPDRDFAPEDWWRTREGQKAMVYELCQWIGFP